MTRASASFGPPPPAAMTRGRLAAFAAALAVLALGAGALTAVRTFGFVAAESFERPCEVRIEPGMTSRRIAHRLEEAGVVQNAWALHWLAQWTENASNLQAGVYRFERPLSTTEALARLRKGSPELIEVTIPEGLTFEETAALLAREGFSSEEGFLEIFGEPSLVRDISPEAETLEGYLFPDTYKFSADESSARIVEAMIFQFEKTFLPAWSARGDAHPLSLHETVTLASLIETETRDDDERGLVSAVYRNRLARGMLLQCDPTVIYAMKRAGVYRGVLTRRHLQDVDSPYNTYVHAGLPPGPIASPGAASLRAALAPDDARFLYFVARPDGRHHFSKTLAEHNRAVYRYRVLKIFPRDEERIR